MSLKDQLRDWLGGLWTDFWNVPFRQVISGVGIVVLLIIRAVWRTRAALDLSAETSYRTFSPLIFLFVLGLLFLAMPRRPR